MCRLEAPALTTLGDDPVDTRCDCLQRGVQARYDMEDGDPGLMQCGSEDVWIARRRRDEPHAVAVYEVDDGGIAHEELRDVHSEGLVGQVAHRRDLVAHLVETPRRRLDDAEAARVRHR